MVRRVRIATWNVNSLNARVGRVERWLETFEPDVLCLQETKLADDAFPALTFEALGYESFHHGQGQWNGVAILSKVGLDDPIGGFGDGAAPDVDARIAWATCGGVRVASCYVPNGRSLDHEHYQYKLRWLDRLAADLDGQCDPADDVVVVGDYNICPADMDCWDPKAFATQTHTSQAERDKLAALEAWGLVDVFREHHDADRLYSWWDYRGGNFHKKMGLRIDLLMTTRSVADATRVALIDRNERKGPKDDPPSDHAPVFIDVER